MDKKIFKVFRNYDFRNNRLIQTKCNTPIQDEHVANKKFVLDEIIKATSKPPTYTNPSISLSNSWPLLGEVGESISGFTATYAKNDAGNLISLQILKNSVQVIQGGISPLTYGVPFLRINGDVTMQAMVSYGAGPIKNYDPSGAPDARPAQLLSANAPQAANNGYFSAPIALRGSYANFYGTPGALPDRSSTIRSLTKNLAKSFNITIPAGVTKCIIAYPASCGDLVLTSVVHMGILQIQIGEYFTKLTNWKTDAGVTNPVIQVADAAGVLNTYKVYKYEFLPFTNNETFAVTIPA